MSKARRILLVLSLCLAVMTPAADAGGDPNLCDEPSESPDVIVGDIDEIIYWGAVDDVSAFSVSTWSCNIGTCQLDWIFDTNEHPVIAQNLFRLKDGRFEQIGQSWLKHGFFALSFDLCTSGCIATDGTHLGVNCSDPYTADLNGTQSQLGPKFEVNPTTGQFPFPFSQPGGATGDAVFKRLQVKTSDVSPEFNAGALYFVEGQYVTHDDAAAGEDDNNASYRRVSFGTDGMGLTASLEDFTVREQPAIAAWKAQDPGVVLTSVDAGDGTFHVASRARPLGNGFWEYEYAVQNLNSHRAARAFRVLIGVGSTVTGIGFHDVDYHSGEPFDGTDWTATVEFDAQGRRRIVWQTEDFATHPNANALRWGTLYNFRFAIDAAPRADLGSGTLELFRPGGGNAVTALVTVPSACNGDGTCDPGEDCISCAADCLGAGETCCGDGVCEGDEDGCICPSDCGNCPVPCDLAEDCADGLFCNGTERCVDGFCGPALEVACVGAVCNEHAETCVECAVSATCDDGDFCNGQETCVAGDCRPGIDPCPGQICDAEAGRCVDCVDDETCSDGIACNGAEACVDGACSVPSVSCVDPQARMGEPLPGLPPGKRLRFEGGRAAFARIHAESDGLGPLYNGQACASCHGGAADGSGSAVVTRFGRADGGGYDPLIEQGGPLLQAQSLGDGCEDALPAEANVVAPQLVRSTLGLGLIEAIPDATLEALADAPPPGVSGRVHPVEPLEGPAAPRAGRFGWKAQSATLLSTVASEARDHIGLTNRLLVEDAAPRGDANLLAVCDTQADPEDTGDPQFIDRVTDYLRYLAPPPQTPRSGLSGETQFLLQGCASCHAPSVSTASAAFVDGVLRDKAIKPYSDFLLHDMGAAGDPTGVGAAQPGEVRTPPLWGLRSRDPLWHDGSVGGGTLAERVMSAVQLHAAPGSEAVGSAQTFLSQSAAIQNLIVTFLDSLGRAEFDHDGDNDIDADDYAEFLACFTGPGGNYGLNHPCRISDFDQDGDVDSLDYDRFLDAFEGVFGGSVPDGAAVPGLPLTLDLASDGTALVLNFDPSCAADDTDYAIYRGLLGDFASHGRFACSTDGALTATLPTPSFSAYYLVVPTNGLSEGSLGSDSQGRPRAAAPQPQACYPQRVVACD